MARWIIPLLLAAGCTVTQTALGPVDGGEDGGRDGGAPEGDAAALDARGPADAGDGPTDAGARDGGCCDDAAVSDAGPPPLCDPSDPDLVACFAFDGDLEDGSAVGHDLLDEASSARFVAGAVGLGLDHAVGDGFWIPHDASLDFDVFTLEAWVRPDVLPSSGRMGLIDRNGELGLFIYAPGEMRCSVGTGIWLADATPLEAGTWSHHACSYDGTQALLYRDGVLVAAMNVARSTAKTPSDVRLGGNVPSGDELDGRLDEVRVWRRALTVSELARAASRR